MNEKTTSKNESYNIRDLHRLVKSGKVRIPEFQRSFRWQRSDIVALFDSILRGYPFGSFLLWRKRAWNDRLTIGAIKVDAQSRDDALWVVDGQQRITSLVNAVDPEASEADGRFRVYYSLTKEEIVDPRDVGNDLVIPLADLFDFGRALNWLTENPDAATYAGQIQEVCSALNQVSMSAAVIEDGDEKVLRDIFDRINSRGRRLNSAEIFDAIHSSVSDDGESRLSLGATAQRIDSDTGFGILPEKVVVQALLVRRHPDITRDVHSEFTAKRLPGSSFPIETEVEAYQRTEEALLHSVKFLQEEIGIPHQSFLPYRFQLLILVRFFSLFGNPKPKTIENLKRWFWRSSLYGGNAGMTGATGNVRSLAGNVIENKEWQSVAGLVKDVSPSDLQIPDVHKFRTNTAEGKAVLAALWSLSPISPETGEALKLGDLTEALDSDNSPAAVAMQLVSSVGDRTVTNDAANRVISTLPRVDFVSALSGDVDLASLLLNERLIELLQRDSREEFLNEREELLSSYLYEFFGNRTGIGQDEAAPLECFMIDDE
ncbi:DUF262 domain-containing protein [Corynebacterium variabile]|uniref:DUF262 domain-containing protein n=1 Tax=Corynebacterium variabile TaxID=1727 RepID=UPI003FCFD26B